MNRVVAIHQPEHMPWCGFFHKMMLADHYVVLDSVQYKKGYFHNRNKVIDRNGKVEYITVSVLISNGRWKNPISEIQTDFNRPWQEKYLARIIECYSESSFFPTLFPEIENIINQRHENIFDLNMELIYLFRDILDISTPMSFSSELQSDLHASKLLLQLCKHAKATTYLAGSSGIDYLNEDIFYKENIKVQYHQFTPPEYEMKDFVPGLSALDLVMRFGPEAAEIINSGGGRSE